MTEESRCNYQEQLGVTFGEIFSRLEAHWAFGLIRVEEFRRLFGDPEQVEFLNTLTGGAFLGNVQQVLWDDLMLRVSRLTDRPKFSRGKENLTVRLLPKMLRNSKDPKLLSKLEQHPTLCCKVAKQVQSACELTQSAREHRNLRIGHADLASDLNAQAEPWPQVSLHDVQVSLDAVHGILNTISECLLNSTKANRVVIRPRALQFVANARQLAESVQFVDSIIDPTGTVKFTDINAARVFLKKLGQSSGWKNVEQVIELRKVASLFKNKT